jgi:hypothetical protein
MRSKDVSRTWSKHVQVFFVGHTVHIKIRGTHRPHKNRAASTALSSSRVQSPREVAAAASAAELERPAEAPPSRAHGLLPPIATPLPTGSGELLRDWCSELLASY